MEKGDCSTPEKKLKQLQEELEERKREITEYLECGQPTAEPCD